MQIILMASHGELAVGHVYDPSDPVVMRCQRENEWVRRVG